MSWDYPSLGLSVPESPPPTSFVELIELQPVCKIEDKMLEGEYRLEIADESDEDAEEINCNGAEMQQ